MRRPSERYADLDRHNSEGFMNIHFGAFFFLIIFFYEANRHASGLITDRSLYICCFAVKIKKEPAHFCTGSLGLPYDFDTVPTFHQPPVATAVQRLQTTLTGCILSKWVHMTSFFLIFIFFIRIMATIPFVKYFCFCARNLAYMVAN